MIVKFFKRGGTNDNKISTGGEGVKNYLLGKDNNREHANLLRGDPEETTEIINGLGFSQIYTAGCLSFDGEETQRVDDQLKQKLMADFERSLFGDFDRSRISGYWVEHTDKKDPRNGLERLELNFVFANVDLQTGKNLTVYLHKIDQSRINDFRDLSVLKHDLSDPNAPERKQTSVISINQSQNQKDLKQAIDNHLIELANQNKLPSHDSVKQALTDLGLEIIAIKKSSISIKNPDPEKTRPIRLTGAFYEQQYSALNYINRAEDSPSPADRNARIDEISARLESRIAKRTNDLYSKLRPRTSKNSEPARAEFERLQFSSRQDTGTDPSNYQLTNNHNLHSDLVSLEHNSFDSDPSLVHAKTANNSFSYGGHSRFIDHILHGLQSPTTQQRNGINNNEQRNNAGSTSHAGANGAKARASFRGVTNAIIGYIDNFEFGTKASIRLFDTAVASERSSDQQLRNGIEQTKAVARSSTQGNNNKRIKADTQPEQAPSPIDSPAPPPAKAGSEKDNREVELMEFYGLMPTHDDTPAPAPYSSPKLQDYGLIPPPNADQIIIEHGEKNATGKRENNKRYTRY
jgi:hypothetical protein